MRSRFFRHAVARIHEPARKQFTCQHIGDVEFRGPRSCLGPLVRDCDSQPPETKQATAKERTRDAACHPPLCIGMFKGSSPAAMVTYATYATQDDVSSPTLAKSAQEVGIIKPRTGCSGNTRTTPNLPACDENRNASPRKENTRRTMPDVAGSYFRDAGVAL